MLPRHDRCVLSRLRCNGHSLLLGSYLSRIGRIENPSCRVGISGSLRGRRSEEMVQSNTSSTGRLEVPFESQRR